MRSASGGRLSTLDSRRGLTLIELLVVIIILTTLVSAAIPIMAPTNDDRRLREASRNANAFITGAQIRAIRTQRPCGVAIKRLAKDTNSDPADPTLPHEDNAVAVEMFYVEQPAPYRGFDRSSSACVARHLNQVGLVMIRFVTRGPTNNDFLPVGWDADLFPPKFVRPGDVVEIDGTRYELILPTIQATNSVRLDDDGFYQKPPGGQGNAPVIIEARPLNDTGQMLNIEHDRYGNRMRDSSSNGERPAAPFWTNPAPYKILRQPVPTSDPPLQMSEGTAIDLRASGVGSDDYFYVPDLHDNPDGILIMFAPEGRVSRVTFSRAPSAADNFDEPVVDTIYLLVGRVENAPPPAVEDDRTLDDVSGLKEQELRELKETVNWLRPESRWIAIGAQSGRVVTVENTFVDLQATLTKYTASPYGLSQSSEELRNAQIHQAREFAREMTQAGGR